MLTKILIGFFTFFQTLCSLELFNMTRENVIIAGKLSEEVNYSMLSPMESLAKEKVNSRLGHILLVTLTVIDLPIFLNK